jgi:acetyltransferase-like isoleucine patch superfamily enzyme
MNYFKYKSIVKKNKKELKKSDNTFVKIPYPFKINPVYLWWGLPKVLFKYFIGNIIKLLPPSFLQIWLLRMLGIKIGKNVGISLGFQIDIWYPDLIKIEDNVIIGTDVKIYTHDISKSRIKLGKVIIRKNALIGANSIIGAGVIIGENSKIGLGSVVTKDTKKDKLYRGYH